MHADCSYVIGACVCAVPVASFVPSRVGLLAYRDHDAGALIFGQERRSW